MPYTHITHILVAPLVFLWRFRRVFRPYEGTHGKVPLLCKITEYGQSIIREKAVEFPFRHRFVISLSVPGIVQWHLEAVATTTTRLLLSLPIRLEVCCHPYWFHSTTHLSLLSFTCGLSLFLVYFLWWLLACIYMAILDRVRAFGRKRRRKYVLGINKVKMWGRAKWDCFVNHFFLFLFKCILNEGFFFFF